MRRGLIILDFSICGSRIASREGLVEPSRGNGRASNPVCSDLISETEIAEMQTHGPKIAGEVAEIIAALRREA